MAGGWSCLFALRSAYLALESEGKCSATNFEQLWLIVWERIQGANLGGNKIIKTRLSIERLTILCKAERALRAGDT